MKAIKSNCTYRQEINKSIFITKLYKINDINLVQYYLDEAKKEYKDATHYCYAYIIDDKKKSSDDKEPGGTAGVPIMEVLLKNELNYILCIVIRYFGGIKLGAGGLVRAYSSSVSNALTNDNIINIYNGFKIKIYSDYNNQKHIDYLIKDLKYDKFFNEKVEYIIYVKEDCLKIFDNKNIKYEILSKEKIEI